MRTKSFLWNLLYKKVSISLLFTLFATESFAAQKVYILGDSRTCCGAEGYAKYVQTYVGSSVEIVGVRAETIDEVGKKVSSMKGAAMVHFMGGLDDLTCMDGLSDAQRKSRYDGYLSTMGSVMGKMKSELSGTVIVHASMFKVSGSNGCSQFGFKDKRGDNNDLCDGKMCRRKNSDVEWFNNGSANVAKDKGIKFQDLYGATKGISQPDERHFNTQGQSEVAKVVAAFIKSILNTTGLNTVQWMSPTRVTLESGISGLAMNNHSDENVNITISSIDGLEINSFILAPNASQQLKTKEGSRLAIVSCHSKSENWSSLTPLLAAK